MKRIFCILVTLAILWVAPLSTAAMASSAEEEIIFEDEAYKYWTVDTGSGIELWGENKGEASGERLIASEATGYGAVDGLLLYTTNRAVDEEDDPEAVDQDQVYLVVWRKGSEDTFVPKPLYAAPEPAMLKGLVKAGKRKEKDDAYFIAYKVKGTMALSLTSPSLPVKITVGKYDTVELHPEGFFYFTNAKGELAAVHPDRQPPQAENLGKMLKHTRPVNGGAYLGWLGPKGELCYTVDGATALTVSDLPKGAAIEFYEGFIIAKFGDYFLAKLTPGEELAPLSGAEYAEISKTSAPLSPYPEAGL